MKKCKGCVICPFIKERKEVKEKNVTWNISTLINCQTFNLVYMIECTKERCNQKYIGETERSLKDRISEHIGYVRTKKSSQATGYHFNLPGHSVGDLKVTGLERVIKPDIEYRKEKESYIIRKFNSFYSGINKEP